MNNQTEHTHNDFSHYGNAIGTEAVVALSVAIETMSNLQYLESVTLANSKFVNQWYNLQSVAPGICTLKIK